MNQSFWQGRRVFVTGHTGFKGSWMCLWLETLGAEVVGYALAPPTVPSLFDLAKVKQGIHSIEGDVRDLPRLAEAMSKCAPSIVIHMAAQSLVRQSYRDPVGTYDTNVMGTINLLESVRRTPSARAVIIITSDKCYHLQGDGRAMTENDPMGGDDPYSSSKGCAELVTAAYRTAFFSAKPSAAAVASARAGNVIGGGDWAQDRLVPDCLRAIQADERLRLRNPDAVRPWQHVLEPLKGYLLLAERLYRQEAEYAEGWNFGPDPADALPVRTVVEQLIRFYGSSTTWSHAGGEQPHEAPCLRLDSSKARARLGWRPCLGIARALEWVVDWHKRQQAGENPRDLCIQQIQDYMAMEVAAT